jgi:hypothetical protein
MFTLPVPISYFNPRPYLNAYGALPWATMGRPFGAMAGLALAAPLGLGPAMVRPGLPTPV